MTIRSLFHNKAFLLSLFIAVVFTILFALGILHLRKPIYIAVVSTLSGEDKVQGESLVKGVKLHIDTVNDQGGVNGKKIKLLVFDDQGSPDIARQKAKEAKNKALVVIGHYSSDLCIAGGEVYKEEHIPAITPSCSADEVTEKNDWYFSVVPNNKYEGAFLANYANRILKHQKVNIIYDDKDSYSLSLVAGFENTFRGLRGTIKHKWVVNANTDIKHFRQQMDVITKTFLRENPGLIFLALHANEAKRLIVSLKRNGMQYPILGGNALGKSSFAKNFNKYPEEMAQPGYFSDGIYAATPLIFDVADESAQQKQNLYLQTYSEKPTWIAAAANEAISVAIKAIKENHIQGEPETLTEDRQKIRDYLAKRTSPKNGFEGINGIFYFDKQGNAVKPLTLGVFKKGRLISAFTQFQPVPESNLIPNLAEEIANERIMIFAGQYMYKTRIVYTGIDFTEISNLDDKTSTYQADFYLWFRYQNHEVSKDLEPTHIEFTNSITVSFKKFNLGKPLFENISDDGTVYKVYRVKADFKERFNFKDYPFDTQKLAVRFRHAKLTHHNIIYVVDLLGLGDTTTTGLLAKLKRNKVLGVITDWKINNAQFFQDITANETTLGNPAFFGTDSQMEYSRFNAVIEVDRNIISFITKNLLPLLFLVGISYLIMFLPFEQIKVTAISSILVAVAFFHLNLANGLPSGIGYAVALDYAFYTIYGLIIFQLLLVIIGHHYHLKENETALRKLIFVGQTVFPMIFVVVGLLAFYIYGDVDDYFDLTQLTTITKGEDTKSATTYEQEALKSSPSQVVLTLGSWHREANNEINQILAHFNQEYPHIQVKLRTFLEYVETIRFQLKNKVGPDIFYVKSYSRSRDLFEAGYLKPLDDLPGMHENFTAEARKPWMGHHGEQYALPFMATSHAIYYNVALFNQLNLKVPQTWEEFLATARNIKEAKVTPLANGLKTPENSTDWIFYNLVPNFIGGKEGRKAYESGKRCFDDEHVVAAFKAIADLAPFLPSSFETISSDRSRQLFLQGKAAMFMSGSWDILDFEKENPDFEWSVFAVPPPAGQPAYINYHPDIGIALNANSKHQQEANIFLAWLAKPETAELFSQKVLGLFPLHKQSPKLHKHAKTFLALNEGRGTDVRWSYPKLLDGLPDGDFLMGENTRAVFTDKRTPEEAAKALQDGLAQWFEPAQQCFQLSDSKE
jgi:branched-chain amino acid transport system substrate-binding protein